MIHIGALDHGDVVSQQLYRNGVENGCDHRVDRWKLNARGRHIPEAGDSFALLSSMEVMRPTGGLEVPLA